MLTFIVTLHHPKPGLSGLVTVMTPYGTVETRTVRAEHCDAFGDRQYPVDLVKRMYPGKANKVHGDELMTFVAPTDDGDKHRYVAVYKVDTD